jgi:Bax protein
LVIKYLKLTFACNFQYLKKVIYLWSLFASLLLANHVQAAPRRLTTHGHAFLDAFLPEVHAVNQHIAFERKLALAQVQQFQKVGKLGPQAWLILKELAGKYQVDTLVPSAPNMNDELSWRMEMLLQRVDIIPYEIVAAQAIIESGWGRSNAAKKTHNYFGITSTRRGMGFAVTASATTTYFLKAYDHLRAGIEDYALILNTHGAYRTFRELRHQARQELRIPTPHELLPGLIRWSERREAYLAKLALVIDHYLPAYNQNKQDIGLHHEPRLWVLKQD